ncbi:MULTISPECIES: four-helix bundle copper-binding protein [Bacillati]|uniref:Four-helix bundle copper-binding protein n=2 Tax=Bacteria TaxID=2 RepID=A0A3S2WYK3_9BACI|nr:four-helix bundle copper-binding protein [Niallia taxi]MDK8643772.1 four-helix bundle copper-binding protein [Niallia taxi]MED4038204.1 four-helix bundle copper-binding protein [Niallia taxi]MED4057674.1 four-helix bundle copper-binding protein [Niallia taxi]MED4122302.1 four-helix bundle copper-binding protein [Niallia taxi]RVT56398.1 four-helix bundle copper-binding protein [Niallia taxi]
MSQEQFQACIDECLACMKVCNHCYDACLKEGDSHHMADCIRLDRECADMCAFAAGAMSRNSQFAHQICQLCAEICEACGNECKKHDHAHCKECAEACFKCADVCRKMAS